MNHHWSVLLDQIALQLDREGMKERENGERGGGGGDYSRKAINQGTAIIPRSTVHEASLSPAGRDTDSQIPANNFHQTNHSTNKLFIYPTALEQSSWTRLQQSHIAWIVTIIELKSLANIKRHDFGIFLSYRIKLTAKTVDEDPAKPPCWTYVTQRHSPDYVLKCRILKRSLSFFYW